MRVIGGKYRGRRIHPPKGMEARPTTDYAKEGLFNVLHHGGVLEGLSVLDLFSGTGSIALEFLSRGAAEAVSVERDQRLVAHMERTADQFGETNWRVVKADVFPFLRAHTGKYDIIFADPPFELEDTLHLPTLVKERDLLKPDGMLIIEHSSRRDLSTLPGFQRRKDYGLVQFSFFDHATP